MRSIRGLGHSSRWGAGAAIWAFASDEPSTTTLAQAVKVCRSLKSACRRRMVVTSF